jgi:hypothetical protein
MMAGADAANTVKVYFLGPIESIAVIIDVLIKLDYEVYSLPESDLPKLIPLLEPDHRSVIYFCLLDDIDAEGQLDNIDALQKALGPNVQFGVFVAQRIAREKRDAFLKRGVATIDLALLRTNALETLKKILLYFEAREKRTYVRARVSGICQVFIKFKNLENALQADLIELSIHAFSCSIHADDKVFFNPSEFIQDVTLILHGKRLRLAARFMGYDKANPNKALFVMYFPLVVDSKVEFKTQLPKEIKNSLYEYIQIFLKENLKKRLSGQAE